MNLNGNNLKITSNNVEETYTVSQTEKIFYTKMNPANPKITSYIFNTYYDSLGLAGVQIGSTMYLRTLGQKFTIKSPPIETATKVQKITKPKRKTNVNIIYTVKAKDTWYSVAKKFDMSAEVLKNNNIKLGELKAGDKLIIK